MKRTQLRGWNVGVEHITIKEPAGDNGGLRDAPGWRLTFIEAIPPTNDVIEFDFGTEVRDMLVRDLTGGIVLHGGDLPKL